MRILIVCGTPSYHGTPSNEDIMKFNRFLCNISGHEIERPDVYFMNRDDVPRDELLTRVIDEEHYIRGYFGIDDVFPMKLSRDEENFDCIWFDACMINLIQAGDRNALSINVFNNWHFMDHLLLYLKAGGYFFISPIVLDYDIEDDKDNVPVLTNQYGLNVRRVFDALFGKYKLIEKYAYWQLNPTMQKPPYIEHVKRKNPNDILRHSHAEEISKNKSDCETKIKDLLHNLSSSENEKKLYMERLKECEDAMNDILRHGNTEELTKMKRDCEAKIKDLLRQITLHEEKEKRYIEELGNHRVVMDELMHENEHLNHEYNKYKQKYLDLQRQQNRS
jgi:hypothetical protein